MSENEIVNEKDGFITKREYVNKNSIEKLLFISKIHKNEKIQLEKLRKNLTNDGFNEVEYNYTNEKHVGRLYGKGPRIQNLPKKIRESICYQDYDDLDMVNALPTLLEQYCFKNDWNCDNLTEYNMNREKYLEAIIEKYNKKKHPIGRDEAKQLMVMMMNGGSFESWKAEYDIPEKAKTWDFLKKIEKEFRNIMTWNWEYHTDKHKFIKEYLRSRKNNKNQNKDPKATLLALQLQSIESESLLETETFLKSKGYEMCVYMYDGGLIRKNDKNELKHVLKELEVHLKKELNYDIYFKIKEMTDHYGENKKNFVDGDDDIDARYVAKHLIQLMKGNIVFTDEHLYMYEAKNGLWTKNQYKIMYTFQNEYYEELKFVQIKNDKEVITNYGGFVSKNEELIKCLKINCVTDNYFSKEKVLTGFGKLLFNNGMYDMDEGVLKSFDPNVTLFAKIYRDFPDRDPEMISKVHKLIFEDPYVDMNVALRLKQEIALGIHGKYYDRRKFVPCVGNSSTCKSVTVDIIKKTFGDYVGTWSTNSLNEGTFESNDPKRLGFLLDIHKNRINLASEYKEGSKLSADIFKMAISGGDEIEARLLYENKSKIINYSTLFSVTNHSILFTNYDDGIKERIDGEIEFEVKFTKNPEEGNNRLKKSDPDLKRNITTNNAYSDAFFWIIMDTYNDLKNNNFSVINPECFDDIDINSQSNKNNISDLFKKIYDKTDDDIDLEFVSNVSDYIKEINKTDSKMNKKELKHHLGQAGAFYICKPAKYNSKSKKPENGYFKGWKLNKDKLSELKSDFLEN